MIYLHHTPINTIIRQNNLQKNQIKSLIYDYRHDYLSKFCQKNHLPAPLYDRQQHGKPFVVNSHLVFNQSHCPSDYALAFSVDVREIGVDIENVSRSVNFNGLAQRYFHADEQALWQNSGRCQELWFKIWTVKEAVLKANGLGIRLNLNELNAKFVNENQGEVCHDELGCYRFECVCHDGCVISLAYSASHDWQAWCWV